MSADVTNSGPRIVVGVDGSPSSRAALRWAIRYADVTGGTVDAVMAWHVPSTLASYPWASLDETDDLQGSALKALEAVLKAGVEAGDSRLASAEVVNGHPAEVLLHAAAGANLLVVGSRGHGRFAEALLGSVAQHCVHHAHCPVLIMRDNPARDAERPPPGTARSARAGAGRMVVTRRGGPGSGPVPGGEQGDDLADGRLPGAWLGYRQVSLDLVPVAATVPLRDHVAGVGQVGNDAVGAALGDAQAGRDVPQSCARVVAMCSRTRAWLVRKPHSAMPLSVQLFLEKYCLFQIAAIGCGQAPGSAAYGGQLPPGSPRGRPT